MNTIILKQRDEQVTIRVELHDVVESERPLPETLSCALGTYATLRTGLSMSLRDLWTSIALASIMYLLTKSTPVALGSVLALSALRWIIFVGALKHAATIAFEQCVNHLLEQDKRMDDNPPPN